MITKHRIIAASTATILASSLLLPIAGAQTAPEVEGIEGSVEWNFKDSFISYLTGNFAGGEVTVTDGATWEKGQPFNFPVNSENSTVTDQDTAVIELDGTVNFNAHGGVLNITISDLELHVDGTTGVLYGDYDSSPFSLEPGEEPIQGNDIRIVDITFDQAVDFSGPVDLSGTTILTEDGVPVFSNYPAGDEFSPLTLEVDPISADPVDPADPAGGLSSSSSSPYNSATDDSADDPTDNEGSLFGQFLNLLNITLGVGAVGAVIATMIKHFTDLLG